MASADNSLAAIAEAYKGIHESTQVIAQATLRLDATQHSLAQTQRGLVWLQGFACVVLGFCLLFTGYTVWQHLTQGQEHAALMQALIETINRLPKP